MAPKSHAYSTSRSLAMIMKFCEEVALMMPRISAKVMVLVAMIMHGRLRINWSVRNLLGMRKRNTKMLSTEATTP